MKSGATSGGFNRLSISACCCAHAGYPPSVDGMTTSIELSKPDAMTFARDGALHIRAALHASDSAEARRCGREFAAGPGRHQALRNSCASAVPCITRRDLEAGSPVLGEAARPVRAILFDKTPSTNWGLPWHQDRTIVVTRRVEVEGFGPWTVKRGLLHVAPPFDLLAGMVTLRIHLDPVPETNAPLLIAPGSHRLEQIPEGEAEVGCSTLRKRHLPRRRRRRLALRDADPSLLRGRARSCSPRVSASRFRGRRSPRRANVARHLKHYCGADLTGWVERSETHHPFYAAI